MVPSSDSFSDPEDDITAFFGGDPAALEKSIMELETRVDASQQQQQLAAPSTSDHTRHKVHKPAHRPNNPAGSRDHQIVGAGGGVGGHGHVNNGHATAIRGRVSSSTSARGAKTAAAETSNFDGNLAHQHQQHQQQQQQERQQQRSRATHLSQATGPTRHAPHQANPNGLAPRPPPAAAAAENRNLQAPTTTTQIQPAKTHAQGPAPATIAATAMPISSSSTTRSYVPAPPPAPFPSTRTAAMTTKATAKAPAPAPMQQQGKDKDEAADDEYDFGDGFDGWDVTEDGRYAVAGAVVGGSKPNRQEGAIAVSRKEDSSIAVAGRGLASDPDMERSMHVEVDMDVQDARKVGAGDEAKQALLGIEPAPAVEPTKITNELLNKQTGAAAASRGPNSPMPDLVVRPRGLTRSQSLGGDGGARGSRSRSPQPNITTTYNQHQRVPGGGGGSGSRMSPAPAQGPFTGQSPTSSGSASHGASAQGQAQQQPQQRQLRPAGSTASAFTRTQSVGASQARRAAILGAANAKAAAANANAATTAAFAPGGDHQRVKEDATGKDPAKSDEETANASDTGKKALVGGFVSGLAAIREAGTAAAAACEARQQSTATPVVDRKAAQEGSRNAAEVAAANRDPKQATLQELAEVAKAKLAAEVELGALKKQIEQLAREKQAAEAKSKEVSMNLLAAKGEVATVRRNHQAIEAARLLAESKLNQKIEQLQEEAQKEKQDHQRAIEQLQTQQAFKSHNEVAASLRPRPPATQRKTVDTPSRTGQRSSQMTRGASNAFETPSKARSGSQRRLLADVDMRTPGRMTTRSSANKAGAPTPDFQKLQNSFAAPATIQNAKRRRKGDVDAMAPSSSPSRPDQPEENDADDAVMADEEQEDCGGMSEEVERAMLLHLLFSHRHLSASAATLYLLLHTDIPDAIETSQWDSLCQTLLRLSGDLQQPLDAVILETSTSLRRMLPILAYSQEAEPTIALLNLLAALQYALPSWHMFADGAGEREQSVLVDVIEAFGDDPLVSKDIGNSLTDLGMALVSDAQSSASLFLRQLFVDPKGIPALLQTDQHWEVIITAIELVEAAAANAFEWKALSCPIKDNPKRIPLFEALCNVLVERPPGMDCLSHSLACLRIVNFFSLLSRATADSVVIMSAEHHLVPTLIRVLNDASDVIYGLAGGESEGSSLTILLSTLSLLHFLAFPSPHPATHEPRPGLELAARLQQAATFREFDGVHEAFISAVGRISYADIDLEFASSQGWEAKQLEGLQFLAQDLLEIVVEGPEGDAIYEMYVVEADQNDSTAVQQEQYGHGMAKGKTGVDAQGDQSMDWDVIDIDAEEAATLAHGHLGSEL